MRIDYNNAGYTEIIIKDNCEFNDFYVFTKQLKSLINIEYVDKFEDFDDLYWSFNFEGCEVVLCYNVYLGIMICSNKFGDADESDNQKIKDLFLKLVVANKEKYKVSIKHLIFKLIIPLTIISFGIFTKWWYALPVDAPDTMYSGFPLPYEGQGWATSMSYQFFLVEFLIDIIIYFLFWITTVFCINRYFKKIIINKISAIIMISLAGFSIIFQSIVFTLDGNAFYIKRPYDIKVLETGYTFSWQIVDHPDYYKYYPKK